jgi:Cellulase (glycosyl hydrolase family 5)
MNSRLTRVFAVGSTLVMMLIGSAAAHAAPGMEVGLQDDAVFLYKNYYNRDVALDQARQLGVTRLRVNVLWDRVASAEANQTTPPAVVTYNWAPYDSLVDAAAAKGIKVQFSIAGPAPAWANGMHRHDLHAGAFKPNPVLYGQFVHAVAQHFAGRVDRYSIWNEPNWKGWLAPLKTGPQQYGKLFKAGYAGVKSVDPNAKVLFGELAPQERKGASTAPLTFIKKAIGRGRITADGFAHHPYAFTVSPTSKKGGPNDATLGTLSRLTNLLKKLAKQHKMRTPQGKSLPVYLTEYGYFARGPRFLGEARRTAYLKQGFQMAQKNPAVRELVQYTLVAPPGNVVWDTSLIGANGAPSSAFTSLSSWAQGAITKGILSAVPTL